MKIFVSEFLSCGACLGDQMPASLLDEGLAMLVALVNDLCQIPDVTVATTLDRRLNPQFCESVEVTRVATAAEERACFESLVAECDATYVIAPEFDSILEKRCQFVVRQQKRSLNIPPATIRLCADKLALAEYLAAQGISTIKTGLVGDIGTFQPATYPLVVKPRHGAGSLSTYVLQSEQQWDIARKQILAEPAFSDYIVQPFQGGEACSVLVCSGNGVDVFPAGYQTTSGELAITYHGGVIPAHNLARQATVVCMVEAISQALPGLVGFWGVDFLLSPDTDAEPVVVEINPRLTTSYVGYRQLTTDNIAGRLLSPATDYPPTEWKHLEAHFSATGACELINCSSNTKSSFV